MNINQITMTPAHAANLLAKNFNNRKIKIALVRKLTNDILNDNWLLTHQPIAIDVHGNILDGQHRLTAILAAQKPVPVMLASDCDPKSMIAVDTGVSRSAADVLTLDGVKNSAIKAAIIRIYLSYYNHPNTWWIGRNVYSVQFLKDEISLVANFDEHLNLCKRVQKGFKLLNLSSLVSFKLLAIDAGHSLETVELFIENLGTGVNQFPGDPIFAYRQYLINNEKTNYIHCRRTQQTLADLIKVFNAYVSQKPTIKFHKPNIPPMPKFE